MAWLFLLLCSSAAAQSRPERVIVKPDSPVMRALHDQPLTADFLPILTAREMFALAGDTNAVAAIDEHLKRAGLLALAGEKPAAQGTIGDLLAQRQPLPPVSPGQVARILTTSLTPRPAPAGAPRKGIAGSYFEAPVEIENTGRNVITQLDVALRVEGVDAPLRCRANPWYDRFAPGERRLHQCIVHADAASLPRIAMRFEAAEKDARRWRLEPTRINFADPAVNFGRNGIYHWLPSAPSERALLALRAASCQERDSCGADLRRTIDNNPQFVIAGVAAIVGFVLGLVLGATTKRTGSWGLGLTLLGPGLVVAAVIYLFQADSGRAAMAGLMIGYFGIFATVTFIPALWIGIGLGARTAKARAS